MKKLLALLLALAMLFSLMTVMTACESSDGRSNYKDSDRDDDDEDEDRDRDDEDRDRDDEDEDDEDTVRDDDDDRKPEDHEDDGKTPEQSGSTGTVSGKQEDVLLTELPIISDDKNLREKNVEDAYGNEYAGPYFDLCSYGDAYRDGEYITQAFTEFNLGGKYRYLTGTFFTRAKQAESYTIEFMVYADDELVYCSEPISRKDRAIDFAIDIGNCDVLRITSRSYDYTSTNTNPGIILVDAKVCSNYTGELTEGVEIDPNLVPLTDLHLYGTDSRAGGDNIHAGPVEDAYGNLYKGIYLELVSWGTTGGKDYDKQAYNEFVTNREYRYLSGTIFARPKQSENFTIEFLVYADDELVYNSGPIDRGTKAIDFVVEIGECDLVRVQTRTKNYTSTGTNPGIFLIDPMVSVEEP